jgi:hypothetical protein
MALAEAMSSRSTNTRTTWRRRIGAVAAAGTSSSRRCSSFRYCRLSRRSTRTKSGMATTITQAPSANLYRTTMATTATERNAPTPFTIALLRQPRSLRRRWCLVMPACDSAKPTNTPMAYSGISFVTSAPVAMTRIAAVPARARMPLEKTRRCPRFVSWRGRKLSPAWKLASRGKSAKPVLAASTRMSMVAPWSE